MNAARPFAIKHVETEEAKHYDEKVYELLLTGAVEEDLRTYVAMLLGGDAGLRRGEILALNVEDVNFSTSAITIRRNVYWERKGARRMVETLPKGKKVKSVAATSRLLGGVEEGGRKQPQRARSPQRRGRAGHAKTPARVDSPRREARRVRSDGMPARAPALPPHPPR